MKSILSAILTFLFSVVCSYSLQAQREIIEQRLNEFRSALDTMIFVNRFLSVESPCLYIDANDHTIAYAHRRVINSDYKIRLNRRKNPTTDVNGTKCMSEHVARYLRFKPDCINVDSQVISGTFEISYAYPASSIMQYLGFTAAQANQTKAYYEKLISLPGSFWLYHEDNKYRVKLVLRDSPYDEDDAYFGYLEIVQDVFRPRPDKVYVFTFDQMSIEKGDHNNQISEKFSSTNHFKERIYYATLAYYILRHGGSADRIKNANAIWLDNFLKNPRCPQCLPVYNITRAILASFASALPNTSPDPAH